MKLLPQKLLPAVRQFLYVSCVFSTLFLQEAFAEINVQRGERLYKQYCTSCHRIDIKFMGPPLRDADKRRPDDWLIEWIRNNKELRAQGDKDAIALFRGYNMEMPSFPLLTDDEIRSILLYVDLQPMPSDITKTNAASSEVYSLYAVIAVSLVAILILIRINYLLLRQLKRRKIKTAPTKKNLRDMLTSGKFIAFTVMVLIFVIIFLTTESAIRLGYSKNYQPRQPIAFSHRIHAGIAKIDCRYCHSGVEKSKTAGIPSLSTCMNCHRAITEGENSFQTSEIQKLISYFNSGKPVAWTRIHNLPDYVYFDHSQHVVVGLVDCETCHGPVDQEDQIYQFTSLSMGWCINCHRQTDVMIADNPFYNTYLGLQQQIHRGDGTLKDSGNVHITEEMVGGTECQRCHY